MESYENYFQIEDHNIFNHLLSKYKYSPIVAYFLKDDLEAYVKI